VKNEVDSNKEADKIRREKKSLKIHQEANLSINIEQIGAKHILEDMLY
jgi:hypothetical protein